MKNPKLTCFLSVILACAASALPLRAEDTNRPPNYPFTLGLEAGTTGLGGSASWRFADHFGVRGGFDYFSYTRNGNIEDVNYHATLRLMSEPLTFDLYPSKQRSFHVSVGALFNQNRLSGTGTGNNGSVTLDGQTFPTSEVGSLNLRIEQHPLDPYLSIGGNFFYFDKAHHWAFGGELGAAYTGQPRVGLTRSGGIASPTIDSALQSEQQKVEHQARQWQFWPVLKLGVSCSF
jgi:hypothetical protein